MQADGASRRGEFSRESLVIDKPSAKINEVANKNDFFGKNLSAARPQNSHLHLLSVTLFPHDRQSWQKETNKKEKKKKRKRKEEKKKKKKMKLGIECFFSAESIFCVPIFVCMVPWPSFLTKTSGRPFPS